MKPFSSGPFLSASLFTHTFSYGLYHDYLLSQALEASLEHEKMIQQAIDDDEDIDYINALRQQSDFYDNLFNISIASHTLYDEV